jgi:hypothetical protein
MSPEAAFVREEKQAEPEVEKRPEPKPKPYKYEVVEPCHRDGLYFDPTNPKAELPMFHWAETPQVSAALKPANDFTRKATEEQRLVFAKVRRENELKSHPELAAMVRENGELKARMDAQGAQLAEAISALKVAAKK